MSTQAPLKTKLRIVRRPRQLEAITKLLLMQREIAFDLETYAFDNGQRLKGKPVVSGFQEWREESRICCISFCWEPGETAVVPLWHDKSPWKDPNEVLKILKPALENPECKYIGHNGKFDCRYLASRKVFVDLTFDTMLAAHMLDENRYKGLKFLSEELLGADEYDLGEEVKNAYFVPLKRLCLYAAKDADYTLRLYHRFRDELKEDPRTARIFKLMMMPASNMLTEVETKGIWIDEPKLDAALEKTNENVKKLEEFMYAHVPEHKRPQEPDPDVRHTKKYLKSISGLNFNSPQQVAEWLFNDLHLDPFKFTDTGAPSTDESVLLQLAHQHIAAKALLKYRKWSKYQGTYLQPLKWKHTDTKSRTHPTYKLFGTVTGRLSCADPNLQQVPRNTFLRGVYGAPPGWKFIEADYSQIELRIAAMLADETSMLRAFHAGRDIHMETAMAVTGLPESQITKEMRKMAKAVNFGFLYGMGAEKFQIYARDNYEIEVTMGEAENARARFFHLWPKLSVWHERQRRRVRAYGHVRSPIGRIRHLPDVHSSDQRLRSEAERQAINSPVQSMASDLMLMSALRLHADLPKEHAFIVGSIHDALGFQCRDNQVAAIVPRIRTLMLAPPAERWFGAELTVPIDVEIKVGQHWGEGEVIDE